jgi:hypothetical protein
MAEEEQQEQQQQRRRQPAQSGSRKDAAEQPSSQPASGSGSLEGSGSQESTATDTASPARDQQFNFNSSSNSTGHNQQRQRPPLSPLPSPARAGGLLPSLAALRLRRTPPRAGRPDATAAAAPDAGRPPSPGSSTVSGAHLSRDTGRSGAWPGSTARSGASVASTGLRSIALDHVLITADDALAGIGESAAAAAAASWVGRGEVASMLFTGPPGEAGVVWRPGMGGADPGSGAAAREAAEAAAALVGDLFRRGSAAAALPRRPPAAAPAAAGPAAAVERTPPAVAADAPAAAGPSARGLAPAPSGGADPSCSSTGRSSQCPVSPFAPYADTPLPDSPSNAAFAQQQQQWGAAPPPPAFVDDGPALPQLRLRVAPRAPVVQGTAAADAAAAPAALANPASGSGRGAPAAIRTAVGGHAAARPGAGGLSSPCSSASSLCSDSRYFRERDDSLDAFDMRHVSMDGVAARAGSGSCGGGGAAGSEAGADDEAGGAAGAAARRRPHRWQSGTGSEESLRELSADGVAAWLGCKAAAAEQMAAARHDDERATALAPALKTALAAQAGSGPGASSAAPGLPPLLRARSRGRLEHLAAAPHPAAAPPHPQPPSQLSDAGASGQGATPRGAGPGSDPLSEPLLRLHIPSHPSIESSLDRLSGRAAAHQPRGVPASPAHSGASPRVVGFECATPTGSFTVNSPQAPGGNLAGGGGAVGGFGGPGSAGSTPHRQPPSPGLLQQVLRGGSGGSTPLAPRALSQPQFQPTARGGAAPAGEPQAPRPAPRQLSGSLDGRPAASEASLTGMLTRAKSTGSMLTPSDAASAAAAVAVTTAEEDAEVAGALAVAGRTASGRLGPEGASGAGRPGSRLSSVAWPSALAAGSPGSSDGEEAAADAAGDAMRPPEASPWQPVDRPPASDRLPPPAAAAAPAPSPGPGPPSAARARVRRRSASFDGAPSAPPPAAHPPHPSPPSVLAKVEGELHEVLVASGRRAAPYVPVRGMTRCVSAWVCDCM